MVQPSKTKSGSPPSDAPVSGRAWLMLALATVGFAVNFWAWALSHTLTSVRAAAEGDKPRPHT
ncbi:hypothetical protein SHIRM173S_05237 [Streptomyces hirsutus]